MGTRLASALVACLVVAACGAAGTPGPSATTRIGGSGAGGPSGAGGGSTITWTWSETVDRSGSGVTDKVHQEYRAVIRLTVTKVDVQAWTFAGQADITAAFTEDFRNNCSHYTDDAKGAGTAAADGGIEAGDGTYQFHVNVLGLTGRNATVRDDSPCGGPNKSETTEWPVAPGTVGGDGTTSDARHITGTWTKPRTGGEEKLAWDLTLPE